MSSRWRSSVVSFAFIPVLTIPIIGSPTTTPPPAVVKLINYFPSHHPWVSMWNNWDSATMDKDFATIAGLNANVVRLLIQPSAFGYPQPSPVPMQHLWDAVTLAANHGLRVQLTLFDLWNKYGDLDGSKRWATAVLTPFRGDKRVQSVELQNEIDGSSAFATNWARLMLPNLRTAAGNIPVTISSKASLTNLQALKRSLSFWQPDFYSFHYYGTAEGALPILKDARSIAAPQSLFVGETGLPSSTGSPLAAPDPNQEAEQSRFIAAVENATQALSLQPAAPWIFQDFAPGVLLSTTPWSEYHFGLLRADGSEKPSATWLRNYFGVRN